MPRGRTNNGPVFSLGVDLGSRAAKLVGLVQHESNQLEIRAAANFGLPNDAVFDGVLKDPRSFGKLIRKQLAPTGWDHASAVFSVPTNVAVLRWVSLPNLEPDELRGAARIKVRRHLPFSVDDAYIEATSPELDEHGELGPSLVIAIPKEVVASRAQALLYAGLNPIRAELEAQAVLRVIERRLSNMNVLWRDASLTIIDFGGTNTHMYVVQNQRLQFMRGVKFGSNLLAKAVADALDLSFDESNELVMAPSTELHVDGTATIMTDAGEARIDLNEPLGKLTREFLRLLRYFRSLHPERSYAGILDNAIICGGLAGLKGLNTYIGQSLGLKVETAQPIAGIVAKFNSESFQSVSNRQEAMTVVIGLALSGINQQVALEATSSAGREFMWTNAA